jgi:hypothetical protein
LVELLTLGSPLFRQTNRFNNVKSFHGIVAQSFFRRSCSFSRAARVKISLS